MGEVHQKLLRREVTGSWLQEELERAVRDRIRTASQQGWGSQRRDTLEENDVPSFWPQFWEKCGMSRTVEYVGLES